ncbi:MAG TPA: transketolase C-terminal domain-containing protein, partial [Candidatus Omnitrophota bacterium]|nr:transketolase C-terminal domain-containing protein [Candidatus Omnitrophota bacterium]
VGADGMSHQGLFDIGYLRHVPEMVVMAPKDIPELKDMLAFAVSLNQAVAIRYPKEDIPVESGLPQEKLTLGYPQVIKDGDDILLLALGSMVRPAMQAAQELAKDGISAKVVNARFAKPLNPGMFMKEISKFKKIVTLEEGVVEGGFGSAVLELLHTYPEHKNAIEIKMIHLPSEFIQHGARSLLLKHCGLDAEGLTKTIKGFMKSPKNGKIFNWISSTLPVKN